MKQRYPRVATVENVVYLPSNNAAVAPDGKIPRNSLDFLDIS